MNDSPFKVYFENACKNYLIDEAFEVIAREAWNEVLKQVRDKFEEEYDVDYDPYPVLYRIIKEL